MISRVESRRTFVKFRESGTKVRGDAVSMVFVSEETSTPQVAFAITRKVGNAVVRNRLRRRLRAAFVAVADQAPLGAYLLIPTRKTGSVVFTELVDGLSANLTTLKGRI